MEVKDLSSIGPKTVLLCCSIFTVIYAIMAFHKPLWGDELLMLITVRRPFVEGLLQRSDYSAPLYQLILRLFIHNDFAPEWIIRAPAFLSAIFSLISIWWFTKIIANKRHIALITTALVAINPVFTSYAAEGRPYTFFLLFSVLSFGTFYLSLDRSKLSYFLLYIISTVILIYSHYYGFLVLLSQFVFFIIDVILIKFEKNRIKFSISFLAILFLVTPALFLISRYILTGTPGTFFIPRPRITDLIWPMQEVDILFGNAGMGAIIMASLIISILYSIKHSGNKSSHMMNPARSDTSHWWLENRKTILCALWIFNSLFLLIWISYFWRPVYLYRYTIPVIVPFTIMFVMQIDRLSKYYQWIILFFVICLMIPGTAGAILEVRNDYPALVNELRKINDDHSEVFVTNWAYTEKFINTEVWGLKYYGYNEPGIKLIKWNYPFGNSIEDDSQFPVDKRFFVVAFAGKKIITKYLEQQPRAFRIKHFKWLDLIEVEKQGERARWLK